MARPRADRQSVVVELEGRGRVHRVKAEMGTLPPHSTSPGETDARVVRWLENGSEFPLPAIIGDYDPMRVPDLPFELASLAPLRRPPMPMEGLRGDAQPPVLDQAGVVDGGAVLRFYELRGALEYPGREIIEANVADPREPAVRHIKETRWSIGGDPCWWIRQQAKEVWLLLELWHAWRERDVPRLQELFGPVQKRVPVRPSAERAVNSRGGDRWELDIWWELSPPEQESRLLERRNHSKPQPTCPVCAPSGRLSRSPREQRPCLEHYWPEAQCVVTQVLWTGERLQLWVASRSPQDDERPAGEKPAYASMPGWETPLAPPRELSPEYFGPMDEADCLSCAWGFIQNRLAEHLKHVFEGVEFAGDDADSVKTVLPIRNLLDAVHFHLWRLISQGEQIGRCRECGLLFRQGRKDNRFCSTRHRNTYWQRSHRHPEWPR